MKIGWAKSLFILLFSSFVGIVANPELPLASDVVELSRIKFTGATETILPPEPEPESDFSVTNVAWVVPVAMPVAPVAAPFNHIQIAGRTLAVSETSDTMNDSGNQVLRYGPKFLYGHNYGNVFGVLYSVSVGENFTLTEDGVVTTYQIQMIAIYEKADDYNLRYEGQNVRMGAVAVARHGEAQYDLALMTCYGTSYGNGDASHRLVVFANRL